ncbi:MAG: POTRA domain-containing protein, partial [Bacteroidota bacterium]
MDKDFVVGRITWKGNTVYSSALLSEVLGVKTGDIFNKETIQQAFSYQPDKKDVTGMYMDNGYLFFRVDMNEQEIDDKVNLTFNISEGNQVSVNNITICCTEKIEASEVLGIIGIQKGELFSRAKIVESQKALKESGLFKTDGMILTPIPNDKGNLVDLEYKMEEI